MTGTRRNLLPESTNINIVQFIHIYSKEIVTMLRYKRRSDRIRTIFQDFFHDFALDLTDKKS
jgi:hypothetical protein